MSENVLVVIIQEWNDIETGNKYILNTGNTYEIFNSILKDNTNGLRHSPFVHIVNTSITDFRWTKYKTWRVLICKEVVIYLKYSNQNGPEKRGYTKWFESTLQSW